MNDSVHSGAERADQNDQAGRHHPILFFDGVCGLCNRFVDLMLRADSQDRFRYAPLQGETAQRMLGMDDEAGGHEADGHEPGEHETGRSAHGGHEADGPLSGSSQVGDPSFGSPQVGGPQVGDPNSFILLENDRLFERSNAVLLALRRLGGAWPLISVLYVFPRPLRDFVYRIVARDRYRWFGKRDECRLPTREERDRFLP